LNEVNRVLGIIEKDKEGKINYEKFLE
jgi:Ca2+-binding EF-hand superfamily protein